MRDEAYMREAFDLAERGRGLVSPNPLVGALVVRDDEIVGRGWHEGPGKPHAEVLALREAREGAHAGTLYTTLEPCDHYGRTPPCSLAIIEAGIARVVAATRDPNPAVNGRGFERLRQAEVTVDEGIFVDEASGQNEGFFKHVRTGLPFVTLKMAATLDGRVAARDGSSRWISGEAARAEVQRMRGAADAIMVGAGTVLADDPSLTVRDPAYRGSPVHRVIVDSQGRVPDSAHVLSDEAPTIVATTDLASRERHEAWRRAGADVVVYEPKDGRVPLVDLFGDLGKRDLQNVLLEGGPTLAWSGVADGCVDKIVLFLAPILIGGRDAPGILGGEGLAPIGEAVRLDVRSVGFVGADIKVEAYVHRDR